MSSPSRIAARRPPSSPLAVALPALAAAVEVKLKLPQRARLDLRAARRSPSRPSSWSPRRARRDACRAANIDVQKEFERYLLKVLRRETELEVDRARAGRLPDLRPRPARQAAGLLARPGRAHPGRPDPRRRPRLRHPGPHRLPHRGVRLAVQRPHLLPPGAGRADRLRVRHPDAGLRRQDRRAALPGQLQGLPELRGRERRSPGRHVREPLLARGPHPRRLHPERGGGHAASCSPQ